MSDKRSDSGETSCLSSNIQEQIKQRAKGSRHKVHHNGLLCSKCLSQPPASLNDRYCHECRAAYNRVRRKAEREELHRLRASQSNTQQVE